jgi:hypothetical protein
LLSGYYIVNAYSGKVLDDPAFSTSNGTQVQQYQLNGLANQRWDLVPLTGGNDLIVNEFSGKVLDDPAYSTSDGAAIQQYQRLGGANQQWKVVALANGNDELVNSYSGKALDDPAFSTANGAIIQQYHLDGLANQQWILLAASAAPAATNYVVNAYSGKVLDDPAFSTSNGTSIQQYQLTCLANQRWDFVPLAGGNDLIVNEYSGKVLDDPAYSTSDGAPIQQYQLLGGTNQQWKLVAQANGNDELVNAYSGKALDDPAFSTANGAVIQQYHLDGLANQQWGISTFANPTSATAYSPPPAAAPLFNTGGPSFLDVSQGAVGDCWLMASLAEVAARDPQDIRNMFTYDGTVVENGATVAEYSVRFFRGDGSAFQVMVDTELPSGGSYYDHVGNALGTKALWVALAEKAYAVANGLGYVTTGQEYQDSYNALNNGDPAWALRAITGKPATDSSINPTSIAAAWNAGNLIVLCTGAPSSSYIVGNHCYAVVGYNASSGEPFDVFNAWGTDSSGWAPGQSGRIYGRFTANAAFITQNFSVQSQGAGAAQGEDIDRAIEELTELTARGEHSNPSGMTRSARHWAADRAVGAETFIDSSPGVRIALV